MDGHVLGGVTNDIKAFKLHTLKDQSEFLAKFKHLKYARGIDCTYNTSLSLLKAPFGALSQLLRWLDHLVLHCTDEAQLG